ncbi:MAG TPA: nitroreductase family protein [Bacteroidales bacterium]|nr:nitroreductase family protein [Bacteroidales bacterium]HSA44358.1 nitroreductase family protein [Bacteroidales bacterium]
MAIPTTRTKEAGLISLITEKCDGCGLCVAVCSDQCLVLENKKVQITTSSHFGCIGCGHCMAVCPGGAIEVTRREISPADIFPLPPPENDATYDSLLSLLQRRRSSRRFLDRTVNPAIISQILDAARSAPMGLPPSDVNVLVLDSREKNHAFAKDYCEFLKGMEWLVSGWFLALMRPFWGKTSDEMFRGFIRPLFRTYTSGMDEGVNNVTYDAPLAMYFYGSPYCDPADPIVAATYAMIAGESLGLGSCMLGAIHPMIQKGKKARQFREKHGIRYPSREGVFVIFGYTAIKYNKGIRRSFASVGWNGNQV